MTSRRLRPELLTAGAFAPYGRVIEAAPDRAAASYDRLVRRRDDLARPSLFTASVAPAPPGPVVATRMERHVATAQMLLPIEGGRWLVLAARDDGHDRPDDDRAAAFLAGPRQGVIIEAGIWHQPLTVLDRPATFLVFMWRDGTEPDVEFAELTHSVTIEVPEADMP